MIIDSPECDGQAQFAQGTVIEGEVKSVHRVGLGFKYETASLEIEFERIVPEDSAPIDLRARVVEVENAREKVKQGVIHGIRGTNSPQDRLSTRIEYLAMRYPDDSLWILPTYRALVPFFPEPEIYFPRGTDFVLESSSPFELAGDYRVNPERHDFSRSDAFELDDMIAAMPERTLTPKGHDADVVNLAFVGTDAQIRAAFDAAGWKSGDPLCRKSILHEIHAFLMVDNYEHGPMKVQYLNGKVADTTWEKGLDSLAKRHHLRIWSMDSKIHGQTVWLSAATREVSGSISLRTMSLIHHLDPDLDSERQIVVRDLALAGCVNAVHVSPRPKMPHSVENPTGDELRTDGSVAVVELKNCENPIFENTADNHEIQSRPPSKWERYVRTQVLSARDIWRENIVYGAYQAAHAAVNAYRRHRENAYNAMKRNSPSPTAMVLDSAPGPSLAK